MKICYVKREWMRIPVRERKKKVTTTKQHILERQGVYWKSLWFCAECARDPRQKGATQSRGLNNNISLVINKFNNETGFTSAKWCGADICKTPWVYWDEVVRQDVKTTCLRPDTALTGSPGWKSIGKESKTIGKHNKSQGISKENWGKS